MKHRTESPYQDYKTERQWALNGFLLKNGAKGVELWANYNHQNWYVYYSPDDVEPATPEQLREFFAPERERKNANARNRITKLKAEIIELEDELNRNYFWKERQKAKSEFTENDLRIRQQRELNKHPENVLVIDTETTGLESDIDEILQLSIIDGTGAVIFNSYFRPEKAERWDDAEAVNGISPDMVRNAPRISEKISEINDILTRAETIIGYNTRFDTDFLESSGVTLPDVLYEDVMLMFAPIYGEWHDYYGNFKWQRLTTAAAYYSYTWDGAAHDSCADCKATLFVYRQIISGAPACRI